MAELEQRGGRTPAPSKWDYASAPESREIVTLEERYGLFVGGEFVEPRSGDYYETIDPASEEPLAAIPRPALRMSRWPSAARGRPSRTGGRRPLQPSVRSTCTGSPRSCRGARASSRCSSR